MARSYRDPMAAQRYRSPRPAHDLASSARVRQRGLHDGRRPPWLPGTPFNSGVATRRGSGPAPDRPGRFPGRQAVLGRAPSKVELPRVTGGRGGAVAGVLVVVGRLGAGRREAAALLRGALGTPSRFGPGYPPWLAVYKSMASRLIGLPFFVFMHTGWNRCNTSLSLSLTVSSFGICQGMSRSALCAR